MKERDYERINDIERIEISIASPEDIRSWSYGEVKKPETINYRSFRAEKDGLFCEKIFGPQKDWECFCGKYKGIKYRGIICDRCGVKITHSKVRRIRMGHINLAAPVAHIWFFKAVPSHMAILLNMKSMDLQQVIYFQRYVVIDPGETPLQKMQILSEEEYNEVKQKYGESFRVGMGAEAIKELLQQLDLNTLSIQLRKEFKETTSLQTKQQILKRLRLVEGFIESGNKPEWMILEVIPVIPPELRPLIPLESGNFATSDLNDLYRRVINRNNRLKNLLELNAPQIIIKNEKRMLQQAVDALFDNARCRRTVLGSGNRPLKSLTDMIKGKQGRFRGNLLGKRVDYSARSVIVVGSELKLHQCGLPKRIVLELYQPFIIRKLKEKGLADNIKSAKKMLETEDERIWEAVDEVIKNHPVLLNRAPTLHRMGIQAFEPILVEGQAIALHPLVCTGYNADFDGDQMAVHIPLSMEAILESYIFMMAEHNIFSPASGEPIITPSQDIVLGCHYLTAVLPDAEPPKKVFVDFDEVEYAYNNKLLKLHDRIFVKLGKQWRKVISDNILTQKKGEDIYETTVGRVFFNRILPEGMSYYNITLKKGNIRDVITECYHVKGKKECVKLLDEIKKLGFHYATLSGVSFAIVDLVIPNNKWDIIREAEKEVAKIERDYKRGILTEGEKYNQIVDIWTEVTERIGNEMMETLKNQKINGKHVLNPIYLMADSGARGSVQQIRQLAGMRGLMSKPSGRIIETPIKSNFKEGLRGIEYFFSTHGARKGLADTALKTADSGYLTRKLVDVAQDQIITMEDCGTVRGITKGVVYRGDRIEVPLSKNIYGRVARDTIVDIVTGEVVVRENELITAEIAKKIEALGHEKIRVRSPLTCEAKHGICAKCYGMDLSTGKLVEVGTAVGIIAAQSIGEPGTQLTMRTFHIGGTAFRTRQESEARNKKAGIVKYENLRIVKNREGKRIVTNRNGFLLITDQKSRELERYSIPAGAEIYFEEGKKVNAKSLLAKWAPNMIPIIAEKEGYVRYESIIPEVTMRMEEDASGIKRKVIIEHKGELHPQIIIEDEKGEILAFYTIPEKAYIEVEEKEKVYPGDILAKTPREITGTQDITGGLPRVTELFEARRPKDPAVMSEIDGVIEFGEKKRSRRVVIVTNETGVRKEYLIPHGKHLRVHAGDRVKAGEPLVDGPLVLQDILRIKGEEELQNYLLREIQGVYLAQNVRIDDKHIEIIIKQMLSKVKIEDPGDSTFLPNEEVDKSVFKEELERITREKGKPPTAKPCLLGITRASLYSKSFISAASFQETTRVLTEAALHGKKDELLGLKENVILGHMIPAGTGFKEYFKKKLIIKDEEASGSGGEENANN